MRARVRAGWRGRGLGDTFASERTDKPFAMDMLHSTLWTDAELDVDIYMDKRRPVRHCYTLVTVFRPKTAEHRRAGPACQAERPGGHETPAHEAGRRWCRRRRVRAGRRRRGRLRAGWRGQNLRVARLGRGERAGRFGCLFADLLRLLSRMLLPLQPLVLSLASCSLHEGLDALSLPTLTRTAPQHRRCPLR